MFNRLNKLSGIGNALFDSLSFGGVPYVPPNYPPYGTLLNTLYGIDYTVNGPQATIGDVNYYANFADRYSYADGEGGEFDEYQNIVEKDQGTTFLSTPQNNYVYICPDTVCNNYAYQEGTYDYYWVGDGLNYSEQFNGTSLTYGDEIARDTILSPDVSGSSIEVPPSSGSYWPNYCYIQGYYYDGDISYYTSAIPESIGQFWPYETPVGSEESGMLFIEELLTYWPNGKSYPYLWDGYGGYYTGNATGSYVPYGTVITAVTDSSQYEFEIVELGQIVGNGKYDLISYLHDGTGGYYITSQTGLGSYHSVNVVYNEENSSPFTEGGVQVLLPDGNLYWNMREVTRYSANGTGGYTVSYNILSYYHWYGYITEFENVIYYWDGNGGYVSQ